MEKRQAQDYIKEVLNTSFDQERFELFMRNLLNDFEIRENSYSGNLIPEAFRDHVSHYKRIGKYTDPEGEELDILIVQVRTVRKLERTRTALRNFVVRHLKTFDKQYALVAFYSKEDDGREWRFSLVKIEYETKKSEKGKIKVEEDLVPAKRFSFLVGEYEGAHTAQKQLLPVLTNDHSNPLIVKEKDGDGSIEGAFSIQKVTDEFYEQYKDLYLKLAENQSLKAALENENLDIERFVKKLLGQIVFLYFIQKKGWLGVPKNAKMGEGSKRFLQDRFELATENGENYYDGFLRYLFYEALAREHNDEGINYYFKKLGCKIPFLNGGLFEADFAWKHTDFTIPNELFRNEEKNKAGDKGTGVLDVFDRYNFTIKEDEPLEKEVAVDPEMLGKVFENMLEIKERKGKGAYYTPREIVHYMCQESLIHYLDNAVNDYTESYQALGDDQSSMFGGSANKKGNLNLEIENKGDVRVPKDDIEIFIRKGHLALEHETTVQAKGKETRDYTYKLPETIRTHAKSLDKALADIKICDPAIGSGAFPVGLLHEIVTARLVLNSFLQKEDYTPYNLKRHAIQESIYGVDIDASAVDIAQLRLWLSMIVDEESYENVESLPNLDYKIVQGNSLIGFPENWNSPAFNKIENLKYQFFDETDSDKKKKLKEQIDQEIQERLKSSERVFGYKVDFDFKLFFSEVWRKKGGFDIVIGNPPYVRVQNLDKSLKKTFKDNFKSAKRNYDIYLLFDEQGLRILNSSGNLVFIQPNKFFNASYGVGLRSHLSNNRSILKIVDFQAEQVFSSATTYTCILHLSRAQQEEFSYIFFNGDNKQKAFLDFTNGHNSKDIKQNSYDFSRHQSSAWSFAAKEVDKIFQKMESQGNSLIDITKKIFVGLQTSADPVYILEKRENGFYSKYLDEVIPLEEQFLKPLLKGAEIRRYRVDFKELYIIFPYKLNEEDASLIPPDIFKANYPLTWNYLNNCSQKLRDRENGKMDHAGWYGYVYPKNLTEFTQPKIMTQVLAKRASMVFDDGFGYRFVGGGNAGGYGIVLNDDSKVSYWYLLSLLNSSLLDFYLQNHSSRFQNGYFSYAKRFISKVPIKVGSNEQQKFISMLGQILQFMHSSHPSNKMMISFFEELLNGMVFELYFQEELAKTNKQIFPHLINFKPINEDMDDEKKLAIIQSEFDRLYDPNHPIRNNLETLDSIEEVRVTKEALK